MTTDQTPLIQPQATAAGAQLLPALHYQRSYRIWWVADTTALLAGGIYSFVLPLILMGIRYFRTIMGCVIASVGVCVGMWLERFLIIVPSLGHKYLPYSFGTYRPQPVEIIVAAATFAAMALLYVLFAKVVPIISIWEMKVGDHK